MGQQTRHLAKVPHLPCPVFSTPLPDQCRDHWGDPPMLLHIGLGQAGDEQPKGGPVRPPGHFRCHRRPNRANYGSDP